MTKLLGQENFINEAKAKQNAMKYFPEAFDKTFNLTGSLSDINKKYLNYCSKYFTKFGTQADLERMDIERAFLYLKRAFLEQTKFNANNRITEKLLNSYEQLITTMSNYEFRKHKDSWGSCQNMASKEILFDISLLKPVLNMSIKNIDIYLDQIMFVDQMEFFYHILMENLNNLINKLDTCNEKLSKAQTNYHNAWEHSKRNFMIRLTDSELGLYKNEWRKQRNNACHEILTFYKDVVKISADVVDPTKSKLVPAHLQVHIENLYSAGIQNIEKGPYYYSFLTKKEIEEQSQKNKKQKQKAKRL